MHGYFIVLDGPDASGTSTHAELLTERLTAKGHDVLLTAEPTDGPIGQQIREFLKTGKADPMELQMLFTNDREWHVKNVIEPALTAGKIVVCDRYWSSTIVYAEAQGLDTTELKKMNNKFIQPAVVIFTLPPLAVSLERMGKRSTREFFEREDLQQKIYEGYAKMAREHPEIHVVDTSGSVLSASAEIVRIVQGHIKR